MKTLRVLYHLARADFLERTRRYSFLLALAAVVYFGYAINAGVFYLKLDEYRGELNAAWVGGLMAAEVIGMLSLFGFYLVKNAVERDAQTGVGEVIATTPLSAPAYLLGKWLSNLAVLSALAGLLGLAALVMQARQGGLAAPDLWALWSPLLLLAFPTMAFVAALAVLFEAVLWLRGGLGNAVFFFGWAFLLMGALFAPTPFLDWSGLQILYKSMGAAARAAYPDYKGGFDLTWQETPPGGLRTFLWTGVDWTPGLALGRVLWLGAAAGLAVAGGLFFDRFDPSRERPRRASGEGEGATPDEARRLRAPDFLLSWSARFSPGHSGFRSVWLAELRLMLKGQRWWWYAAALVWVGGGLFAPADQVRQRWLPMAWLWPLLLWSAMGCREARQRTDQLVFSSAHPLRRQLPAAYLAGLSVTVLLGGGAGLRLLLGGEWPALGAWAAGALFIPSLALALGAWSGGHKLFEVVYVLLWYLGPTHPKEMPELDFMGAADASVARGMPGVYLILALLLMGVALLGRRRQTWTA